MYLPAKFSGLRSYASGDLDPYINSYIFQKKLNLRPQSAISTELQNKEYQSTVPKSQKSGGEGEERKHDPFASAAFIES